MNTIDPRIHQVLDGELPREALPAELRPALSRLEAVGDVLRRETIRGTVAARVFAEIRRPHHGRLVRLARWFTERHPITISLRPVWTLALAVLVAAVALLPSAGPAGRAEQLLSAQEGIAQFVGRFPDARSVEVVGSFTDWRPGAIPLQDDDRDGVWQTEVVLPAGEHEYMFVVDGERWVPDPLAGRYADDGFGRQNAVIIVRPAAVR